MATESIIRRIELDETASETLREKLERVAEIIDENKIAFLIAKPISLPETSEETIDKIVEKH